MKGIYQYQDLETGEIVYIGILIGMEKENRLVQLILKN